ncbi:MAG: crotonase/enoyl-CoA hydratase family protein [Geodermatophilaceae bacterium]|nr:crotonase/enoyl-CoA hydratase family protein [Geodermatophilaceae bacterium]MDQ3455170.1 crotonase/enoyl-CoA hydratase family protein [Actinomycetota bacterium]
MADEVLTERDGAVLVITLNRPQAKNAVNRALAEGLAAALDELDGEDAVKVGVLTGAGGAFSAGMDLKAFLQGEFPTVKGRGFGGITEKPPVKPLVAAVEGVALAGGLEIVLSCDLVVAANDARFGIPETKVGLLAGAGGLIRLPQRIPVNIAMECALTGDFFSAADARAWGLVNRLTEPGEALAAGRELAAKVAANGPLGVVASKRIIREAAYWPAEELWSRQAEAMGPVFGSEDAKEGAAAFAEKRKPVWQGR